MYFQKPKIEQNKGEPYKIRVEGIRPPTVGQLPVKTGNESSDWKDDIIRYFKKCYQLIKVRC